MNERVAQCPHCCGTGVLEILVSRGHAAHDGCGPCPDCFDATKSVTCDLCNGSGVIAFEKAEQIARRVFETDAYDAMCVELKNKEAEKRSEFAARWKYAYAVVLVAIYGFAIWIVGMGAEALIAAGLLLPVLSFVWLIWTAKPNNEIFLRQSSVVMRPVWWRKEDDKHGFIYTFKRPIGSEWKQMPEND